MFQRRVTRETDGASGVTEGRPTGDHRPYPSSLRRAVLEARSKEDGMRNAIIGGLAAGTACALVFQRAWQPWQQRWGATEEEVSAPLPGDGLVAEPASQITRAITIEAPRDAVWPWLVQLGADRGGFYSYDALENLFGLGIHSAAEIVEEWQDLAPGDLVAAIRSGDAGWYVMDVRPGEALVLKVADVAAGRPTARDDPAGWEFLWTFALRPVGPDRTRLLVRERAAFGSRLRRWLMSPVGQVSFVMTRRMMLGIKERAERQAARAPAGAAASG
jgi:hypothetical protein